MLCFLPCLTNTRKNPTSCKVSRAVKPLALEIGLASDLHNLKEYPQWTILCRSWYQAEITLRKADLFGTLENYPPGIPTFLQLWHRAFDTKEPITEESITLIQFLPEAFRTEFEPWWASLGLSEISDTAQLSNLTWCAGGPGGIAILVLALFRYGRLDEKHKKAWLEMLETTTKVFGLISDNVNLYVLHFKANIPKLTPRSTTKKAQPSKKQALKRKEDDGAGATAKKQSLKRKGDHRAPATSKRQK
jgi:hypothetical protein